MPPEVAAITIIPFLAAFVVAMIFGPGVIATLKRLNMGQTISADGPESHLAKAGTPTMGGTIILAGVLAAVGVVLWVFRGSSLAWIEQVKPGRCDLIAAVLLMVSYAALGIVDDYLTIHPVRGVRGISSKPKAAVQILLAIAFVMWLAYHRPGGFMPALVWHGVPILTGWVYWVFAVLYIVGMTNFVNIADGLDGLVSGLMWLACSAFIGCILYLPWPASWEADLALYALPSAMAGACLAFLWFNTNPARVFMGDTGSLALGAGLSAAAILAHKEVLVVVIGLVFVLDGLSTVIQWAVFKFTRITTGAGRRVFRKSPIHHHFELCGWPEQAVVVRFWIMGAIAAVLAYVGVGWRLW